MSKPLVSDTLWETIAPLLPPEPPKPKGGRPRVPDRAALTGILFVLRSGIPWELLPQEMDCGSGVTCWRRLRDWQRAGVWQRLHQALLDRLGIPLAEELTAANVPDGCRCTALVDAVAPIHQPRGAPRRRPEKYHND